MKRQILISSLILLFTAGLAKADTIHVPGAFPYIDIQQAIDIAQTGDVIIIAPGTYIGTGYTINKGITITGADPNNPSVVAATVIDCGGQDVLAFDLTSGAQKTLSGITIANSWRGWYPVPDGIDPGDDGAPGISNIGISGIKINGSHIVSSCIIRNCILDPSYGGGNGADGGLGDYPDPEDPGVLPVNYGGNGGRGGHAYGAGIYIDSGSPQILNTVVEDCVAIGGPGGAGGAGLDANPPDANLPGGPGGDGGNGGNAMGAGVYCDSGTSPTFENCIIRNCQVYAGEAADGGEGGDGIVDDFNLAFPGGDGGHGGVPGLVRGAGVYCETSVNATFTNCQFIGNRAYGANGGDGGDGGEVHLAMPGLEGGYGGLVEESYSQPGTPQDGNPPSDYSAKGAGVYIENGVTATFTGCTFRDNVTRCSVSGRGGWPSRGRQEHPRKNFPIPTYGAGVFVDRSTTTFADCTIQGNWTTQEPNQYEGDLYPYGSDPSPDFEYPDVEYTGYGGGMCFDGGILGMGNFGYVELNHCNIADNNAPVGGGVFASALTDFHADECNFVGNWAYLGAGLFSIDNYSTISRSNFIGNRADDPEKAIYGSGGGLFSFSTDVLISDCIFRENTTNGFGAGIYMSGEVAIPPLTAEPVLKNCLLSNNEAGFDGGGIHCDWYTEPNIINCTITGNEAKGDPPLGVGYGGGLYCSYGSNVNIINSIFWDNAGPNTIGPELAVETWPFFPPTTLTVSNCDVEGGEEEVWVDDDSTLNWGAGNIHTDPLFVTGPLGDYYLSQTDANSASYPGQDTNSPCVDAGSDPAINVGLLHLYTTRTDEVFDTNMVDMGYHYPLAHPIELCGLCDLSNDGIVNFADFAILSSPMYWLRDDCSADNNWCDGADLTFDGYINFEDLAFFVECWLAEDTSPPLPNPSRWEIEPYSTTMIPPYAVSMTAEAAFDDWGGVVKYYFECVSGNDSGWGTSNTYTDTGLDVSTEYGYRVKARDERGNETLWSVVGYAITGEDTTPPSPDSMTWETEPYATSSVSIAMTATTAFDDSGVEYYFECTTDDVNSDWQDSTTWEDTGLEPSTTYTYRVKARDKSINRNETSWSISTDATTLAEDLTPPTPDPMTWATEPYATSPTSISMVATTATDVSGVEYYFECTSHGQYSSDWQDSPEYSVTVAEGALYTFVVRARDKSPNQNTTGDSPEIAADPDPPTPDPMTWATEPYATSPTSISMVATTATDVSGVEYYFECTSHGQYSSDWQDSPEYSVTVAEGALYTFVVRARDKSPNRNTTGDSEAVTVDMMPPTPDPSQWAAGGEPTQYYGSGYYNGEYFENYYWHTMTAEPASDAQNEPVEYYFKLVAGGYGPVSSGWQEESIYDYPVSANSAQYGVYKVRTRDAADPPNETAWSEMRSTLE